YAFAHKALPYPDPDGWLVGPAQRYPELAIDYILADYQWPYARRVVIRRGQVVRTDWLGPNGSDGSWGNEVTRCEAEAGWSVNAEQLAPSPTTPPGGPRGNEEF